MMIFRVEHKSDQSNHRYGFESMEALVDWFHVETLDALRHTYVLGIYDAEGWKNEGDSMISFFMSSAEKLSTESLDSLIWNV